MISLKNEELISLLNVKHSPKNLLLSYKLPCHDVDIKVVERLIQDELHSENGVLLDGVEFSEETIRREEFFAFLYPSNRPEHHKDKFITEHVNLNFNTIKVGFRTSNRSTLNKPFLCSVYFFYVGPSKEDIFFWDTI